MFKEQQGNPGHPKYEKQKGRMFSLALEAMILTWLIVGEQSWNWIK